MTVELGTIFALTILIAGLLAGALFAWRHSGSWLRNAVFTIASIAIVTSWIVLIYAVFHFGPALAK